MSIDDCKARLTATVKTSWRAWAFDDPSSHPEVYGTILGTAFQLRVRTYWCRSCATVFSGRFTTSNNETLIQGEFSIHPALKAFLICWCLGIGLFALLVISSLWNGASVKDVGIMLIYLACGLASPIVLVKACRWFGRGQQKTIAEFLRKTFEAHDAS